MIRLFVTKINTVTVFSVTGMDDAPGRRSPKGRPLDTEFVMLLQKKEY
jgi:hypothetical protein